jgi:hypothetical protein
MRYDEIEAKIESFKNLPEGWDSYNAPQIKDFAIETAKIVVDCLKDISKYPTDVMPSVEGGIYFLFTKGEQHYCDLECDNDGDLLACIIQYNPDLDLDIFEVEVNKKEIIKALNTIFKALEHEYMNSIFRALEYEYMNSINKE